MTAQKTILQNAYETTLALAIGADATEQSVQVNAAPVGTPSTSNPMYLVIDPDSDSTREYVKVTARSGVSLTVDRNIDSDSGGLNAHAVGAKVRMVAMKQHFDDLNDRVSTIINDDGSAVVTTGVVKDEDNMASDSATHLATQQSIKAYVDATIDSTEEVQDVVGGMVTGNTETFIDVTYEDGDGTLDFVVPVKDEDNMASDSATHLATQQSIKAYVDDVAQTTEEVQDIVGAMFSGNTETRVTVTYDDTDGTIDVVVDDLNTDTQLTDEQVQDIVGAMVSGNTETNIAVTYDDTAGKLNFVSTDTNTQLTTEEVQDIVGAMLSGNTETRIAVTYDDTDGTIDFVVDDMTSDTQLTTEQVQDIVGAMFTGNTETRISATYEDGDGTIDLVVDDMTANTQLTTEEVQDIVGAMFTGNTETNITVTYEDSDGTIDLVATGNTTEQIQDIVGAMFSGNTETGITATYEDSDGTIDLVVSGVDATQIVDADSDTKIQVEEGADEDIIRFDTAGTERATMSTTLALTSAGGAYVHSQNQTSNYTIGSTDGAVYAGPLTISGVVTNAGTMVIL
jgi:hypothetical protein